mgnify:CR=1 FL=1
MINQSNGLCSRDNIISVNHFLQSLLKSSVLPYVILFFQVPTCSPAPAGYAPSIDWQKKQVAAFSQVRMVRLKAWFFL